MRLPRCAALALVFCLFQIQVSFASAYNGHPKLVVIVVIDQFRADYLERYRDQFGEGGFKLFLEHGAYFTDCNYDYAVTQTAPGHATLLSGTYPNAHGIMANEWWDPNLKRMVTSVQDSSTSLLGIPGNPTGGSPRHLQSDTLGDELRLATQGKSRVFAVALKDRAAILSAGFSGNGAYWIDAKTGAWVTSTYYRSDLPAWAQDFNNSKQAEKYLNREWKDAGGHVLRTTDLQPGKQDYFETVGSTPFANDYEFDFARDLVTYEKLGQGPATDLLIVGLSANDILGHAVGPDSPEMRAMALSLDRQLAGFFEFLGHQLGLANVWIALSADHGVAPVPDVAGKLHIPAVGISGKKMQARLNSELSAKLTPGRSTVFVEGLELTTAWLNDQAFAAAKVKEDDAEKMVGESLKKLGFETYFTRSQLMRGDLPRNSIGIKYRNSYFPLSSWHVMLVPPPFMLLDETGTSHGSPYTYDTHVPLALYGIPFQPGTYRNFVEPIDLAPTLASLLGINAPTHAIGRVLTESLAQRRAEGAQTAPHSSPPTSPFQPASLQLQEAAR